MITLKNDWLGLMNNINWRGIDLNLLLTFDALFQFKSVSAASKYMNLGQPATSYNLKRLRELLDDPLFERVGNSMVATKRANEIAPKVDAILSIIRQDILPVSKFDPINFDGMFIVGLNDYAEQIFGPDIFDYLQQVAPKAKILFKPVDNENSLYLLEEHNTDLCIGVFSSLPDSVVSTFLYREKHLCTFDNSELEAQLPISLEAYLQVPQVIVTANECLTTKVDETLAGYGVERNVVLGTTRFLTIRRMLSGRKMLAVMAEMVGRSDLIDDQLTLCEPPIDIPDFDVEMIGLKRNQHHPKQVWLSEKIKKIIQTKVQNK